MSCYSKEELENMLEDVVNELDLSDLSTYEHGQLGTPPAELIRHILKEKNNKIRMLENEVINIDKALIDSMNLFESIICLRAEGVSLHPAHQILDTIEKEAVNGYNICKNIIEHSTK